MGWRMNKNAAKQTRRYTIDDLIFFVDVNKFLFPRILGERSASRESIDELERVLRVKLPDDYRRFLSEFGYLIYNGKVFYGICYDDPRQFDFACNAADLTLRLRKESALPRRYLAFYDADGDKQLCFDVSKPRSNVVVWDYFGQCVDRKTDKDFVNMIFAFIERLIDKNPDAAGKTITWPE